MSWSFRFRARQYLRGSLWVIPLTGAIVGVLLAFLSIYLDSVLTLPEAWTYSPGAAATVLVAVVGAMVGLAGFVVTISVLVVQMATGTFSARYMRLWYRDRILKAVLAWLIGTMTFAYALLRRVAADSVPNLGVTLTGVFVLVGVALFVIFLDRFVHRLRPVAVTALVAKAGRISVHETRRVPRRRSRSTPPRAPQPTRFERSTLDRSRRSTRTAWSPGPSATTPSSSYPTPSATSSPGERRFEVYGAGAPASAERELRGMIALGVERTIEQDTAYAIRIMVDIAIKALSAAVNDPTTAIQVLDHLGDTLSAIGRTPGLTDGRVTFAGADGTPRVVISDNRWEDYLSLGVTEIREYGTNSIQVVRRLRAMLEDLQASVLPEYLPAVERELARLDASVAARYGETVDADLASGSDRQGIGGPAVLELGRS